MRTNEAPLLTRSQRALSPVGTALEFQRLAAIFQSSWLNADFEEDRGRMFSEDDELRRVGREMICGVPCSIVTNRLGSVLKLVDLMCLNLLQPHLIKV